MGWRWGGGDGDGEDEMEIVRWRDGDGEMAYKNPQGCELQPTYLAVHLVYQPAPGGRGVSRSMGRHGVHRP